MGGGGSSGGGGTTQSVSNSYSSLSPWIAPYVTSMLGAAQQQVFQSTPTAAIPGTPAGNYDAQGNPVQGGGYDAQGNPAPGTPGTPANTQITGMNPYQAYGSINPQTGQQYGMSASNMAAANASVAPFSQLQNQSFQGAGNLQTPGQFGQATNLANTAGMGALGTTGQAGMYGGMGAQAGQQAAGMSNMYGGMGAQAGQQAAGMSNMYGGMGAQAGQQAAGMSNMYGQAGAQTGQQYGGLSAMQGQQGANIGASLGQMSTNPNAVGAYMNPYLQNSLNPQLQLANQQYGIAGQQQQGAATSAGAFGGSRSALANSLNQQNQMLAQNQIIGQGYNTAFNNAQQQMNAANQAALAGNQQALAGYGQAGSQALQGLGMGLQGAGQAGAQAMQGYGMGLQGAQQAGAQAMQGYGMGLQGAQQAGNLGIAGAQAGLQGIGAQQAGYGLAGQQAANLANIGTGQLGAQQNILNQQNTLGQQQTAGTQAIINQAMQNYQTGQQYPMTQLTNLKNLLSGVPITDTTQTQQTAPPSTANLIGGAGMTLLGAGLAGSGGSNVTINNPAPKSAQGGIMKLQTKKYSTGGIGSIMNKAVSDPASVPDQSLKDGVIPKGLPADLVQAMKTNAQQQAQAPAQAPTSTVIQDINNQATQQQAQAQQIDEQKLLQQLPTIMADLKVARDIAKEKGDKAEVKAVDQKIAEISMLAQRAQEKMQMQPAQGQGPMTAPPPQGIDAAMAQQQQQQAAMAQQPQQQAPAPQGIAQAANGGIMQFYKGGEVKRYANTGLTDVNPTYTQSDWAKNLFSTPTDVSNANTIDPMTGDILNVPVSKSAKAPVVTSAPADNTKLKPDPLGRYVANEEKPAEKPAAKKEYPPKEEKVEPKAPVPPLEQFDVKGTTNDVTKMISNWSDMLMGQYNKDTSMQDFGRGLIKGGARWAGYTGAGTGLGQGIAGAGEGYLESTLASEARKDKQLGQLMSLGLSGMDLRMKAAQLGISQQDLQQKGLLIPSEIKSKNAIADYHEEMANYVRSGKGGEKLGNLSGKDAAAMRGEVDDWLSKPNAKGNATLWRTLGQLPNGAILQAKLSASPSSELYKEGVKEINQGDFRKALLKQYILEPRLYSSTSKNGIPSSIGE